MIRAEHIVKTFDGRVVLDDISVEFETGKTNLIIGRSGSGKTVLLKTLVGLHEPDSGDVWYDDTNFTRLDFRERRAIRKDIGMIFQGFNLLEQRTVLSNVAFPLMLAGEKKDKAQARAAELLGLVGLSDKARSYPSQLSGGQKQRVAIARALSTSPKYLLCDEATSALDPNTTRAILELLRQINRDLGVTIIIITHEMKVIDQICDRVAVIDHSSIAEEGKVSDVFTNPQSQIARELILPQDISAAQTSGGAQLRIIFSGESAKQPVLSQLTLECQVPVNILFADTKEVEGKAYGQMLLELPCDENQAEKVRAWLRSSGIQWKEESK